MRDNSNGLSVPLWAAEITKNRPPPVRCGSYPYRYIAEDFGLPYDVVLNYSEGMRGLGTVWSQRAAHDVLLLIPSEKERLRFRMAVKNQVKHG